MLNEFVIHDLMHSMKPISPVKAAIAPSKRRPLVYIAGPISKGCLASNVNQATEAFVKLAKAGLAPLCPHWSVFSGGCTYYDGDSRVMAIGTVQGNKSMSHADWLGIDVEWVAVSDAVLRLPGESVGADEEVRTAEALGIPVYRSVEAVVLAHRFAEFGR